MNSALNIIKYGSLHDFKKLGYYNNMTTGTPLAFDGYLIPCFHGYVGGSDVNIFNLERLDCSGNVIETHVLTTTWVTVDTSGDQNIFIYNANVDILATLASYNNGMYRYKFSVGSGAAGYAIYYSEIFEIADYKLATTIEPDGDFNNDFNNDYYN